MKAGQGAVPVGNHPKNLLMLCSVACDFSGLPQYSIARKPKFLAYFFAFFSYLPLFFAYLTTVSTSDSIFDVFFSARCEYPSKLMIIDKESNFFHDF